MAGLSVFCFHKRYYVQISQASGSPYDLGRSVTSDIPSGREDYIAWLEAQRNRTKYWEWRCKKDSAVDARCLNPEYMHDDHSVQTEKIEARWVTPLNGADPSTDWIYIIDLDSEIFSVNNTAYFKLERVVHIDWIAKLLETGVAERGPIYRSELIPKIAIARVGQPIAAWDSTWNDSVEHQSTCCTHQLLEPETLASIPWRRRHGFVLRLLLFTVWSDSMGLSLMFSLHRSQWILEDPPFREIVYTILCLAAGGNYLTAMPDPDPQSTAVKHNHVLVKKFAGLEFMSLAMTGSHLRGRSRGSHLEQTVYWLGSVLVVLASELHQPQKVEDALLIAIKHGRENKGAITVDAVLVSVEHVVIVRLLPSGETQHSTPLPLFGFSRPFEPDENLANKNSYLRTSQSGKVASRVQGEITSSESDRGQSQVLRASENAPKNAEEEVSQPGQPAIQDYRFRVKGTDKSTFCALMHLFDSAAYRQFIPSKTREGCFPNEIYFKILKHVKDMDTRSACMEVSRTFRDYCLENQLLADNVLLTPIHDAKHCTKPGHIPKHGFVLSNPDDDRVVRADFGSLWEVSSEENQHPRHDRLFPRWTVAIGVERNRKILLTDLKFRFSINSPRVCEIGKTCSADRRCIDKANSIHAHRPEWASHIVSQHLGGDHKPCIVPECPVVWSFNSDKANENSHLRNCHMYSDKPPPPGGKQGVWLSVERARELGLGDIDPRTKPGWRRRILSVAFSREG